MESTYILYNIVPVGFILLLIYMFIDIFLDRFRKSTPSIVRRVLLYSFLFYLLSLIQIKFGGFSVPLLNKEDIRSTFISTNDWFGIYEGLNSKVTMGSRAFLYNFLLFIPLGIYLSLLFNLKSTRKAASILIVSCSVFVMCHFAFHSIGLVFINLNILDILYLFLNIAGGTIGFSLTKQMNKRQRKTVMIEYGNN